MLTFRNAMHVVNLSLQFHLFTYFIIHYVIPNWIKRFFCTIETFLAFLWRKKMCCSDGGVGGGITLAVLDLDSVQIMRLWSKSNYFDEKFFVGLLWAGCLYICLCIAIFFVCCVFLFVCTVHAICVCISFLWSTKILVFQLKVSLCYSVKSLGEPRALAI